MKSDNQPLQALYGGTFDPIHYGHIKPVMALAETLSLDTIVIMPNHVPPHRPQPEASSQQRKRMIELAIQGNPLFRLDDRELRRTSPSWTVDTLEEIRAEKGHALPLAFIIGQDSLLSLHHWHRWEELLILCHLIVMQRPGVSLRLETSEQQKWLQYHQITETAHLHQQPAGCVYLAQTPLYPISATLIRKRLAAGLSCKGLLPDAVLHYIWEQHLYQR